MVVGVLELTLAIPAASLKEKRGVVKRIVGRTRNKFNVSAAEVDELDNPGAAVLGIITVANDRKFINSVLNKIINFNIIDIVFQLKDFNTFLQGVYCIGNWQIKCQTCLLIVCNRI